MGNPEPPNPQHPIPPPGPPLPVQPQDAPPPQPGQVPTPQPPQPGYGPPGGVPGYGPPPGAPPGYGHPGYPYPNVRAGSTRPARRTGLIIGIAAGAVVLLLLLLVCGVGAFFWYRQSGSGGGGDPSRVVNYRETDPEALSTNHVEGPVSYPMSPPAGGPHYQEWQNCNGDVYPAPIEDGNAVHSLEHGAVWITYQPNLSESDVERLAERVRGQTHLLLSPYPGQASPVSLQAWGYQLAVEDVDDESIDEFIRTYRVTAAIEPGAPCGGGITTTR